MRHRYRLMLATAPALAALAAVLAPSTATAAPATQPAASGHHFRIQGARLCMRVNHNGNRNSLMILGRCQNGPAENITFRGDGGSVKGFPIGKLWVTGHRATCVSTDRSISEARTAISCGTDRARWVRVPVPHHGVQFVNWGAHLADPFHEKYLLVPARRNGLILAVGTNTALPHYWLGCTGRCASATQAPAAALFGPPGMHPADPIFGVDPDCQWPILTIAKVHIRHGRHPHVIIGWGGHLRCTTRPASLTSFATLQRQNPQTGKWELLHVTKTRNGVHFVHPHLWTLNIPGPDHGCLIAKLRSNWNSLGESSSGDPDEGSFCSPVLRITSCGSSGADVVKRGSSKRGCPHPLLT